MRKIVILAILVLFCITYGCNIIERASLSTNLYPDFWDDMQYYHMVVFSILSLIIILLFYNIKIKKKNILFSYISILFCLFVLFLSLMYIIQGKTEQGIQHRQRSTFRYNTEDIKGYMRQNGKFPQALLDALKEDYPRPCRGGVLDKLSDRTIRYRLTAGGGVTNIVQEFDGTGGWVYNPEQGIFGLNVRGMEQYTTNLTSYLEEVRNIAKKQRLEQ
jgi:multisubunit Na+/H+ antiporter MnhG subunit